MGNNKSVQSDETEKISLSKWIKTTNKSCIFGNVTTVEDIISRCVNENFNDEKHCQDPLEMNSVSCYKLEDLQNSSFSIAKLARQLCKVGYGELPCFRSQQPSTDFDAIYDFLQFSIVLLKVNPKPIKRATLTDLNTESIYGVKYVALDHEFDRSINKNVVDQIYLELFKELCKIKTEFDSWEKSFNSSALNHFNTGLNIWCSKPKINRKDWASIINEMSSFISVKPINDSKYLEAYITALSLYTFAALSQDHDKTKICSMINRSCELLLSFIHTSTLHNAEGSFAHNSELPGVRLIDIFGGLHQGLKTATIQKFVCEQDNVISTSYTSKFAPGFDKLNILPPITISKNEKWNNITVKIDVAYPSAFSIKTYIDIPQFPELLDMRSETWEFRPNENNVYISQLVFRAISEISSILAIIDPSDNNNEDSDGSSVSSQETMFTVNNDYSRFKKCYYRKVYCGLHGEFYEDQDDIIPNIQSSWVVY
ncbi:2532_t:CDS:1 [Scutellospora calospora]|uniref:2532_t:CDS:1 n=1 Tax=Scutellospora calospora TaxID=85575 RepID=A0ACA9LR88_9GLOM|nr:2532_t:CDS:1 [Scutellospora calospora]